MGPSFDPGYLVRVVLHCNTKLIWQPNHASADSNDGSTDIARILRPTLERRASGLGQDIDTALGAVEPAINIVRR